ncbi:hypothetical protein GQ600_27454 [Phytophthora cactorum]|nr:hypothetical protein GQ600_27454 [Phytophthora cactorum]
MPIPSRLQWLPMFPQYDTSNSVVGYVDESCHDGRAEGLDELFDGEPYMAYDYYNDGDCSDYENSASYRATGDCETFGNHYYEFDVAISDISDTGNACKNFDEILGGYIFYNTSVDLAASSSSSSFVVSSSSSTSKDSSLAASSSSSSPTSNDSTLSTGAIAGVAIGAAVLWR